MYRIIFIVSKFGCTLIIQYFFYTNIAMQNIYIR